MSLTVRALFQNTLGQTVAFGTHRPTRIHGAQTSAVQQALARLGLGLSPYLALNDFNTRETAIVIQNGGFVIGNVVVGNLSINDFPKLPGALDFVLAWNGTPQSQLNDLNLSVFSPLNSTSNPDFVANPPFIYSLNPNSPKTKAIIKASYPNVSRSGGRISQNSVGPQGLEIAYWPKGFPTGNYRAFVYDLVDANPPPTTVTNPVTYSLEVFINGTLTYSNANLTIGLLQTSGGIQFAIPPAAPGAAIAATKPRAGSLPAARIPHVKRGENVNSASTPSVPNAHAALATARTSAR
jgi:hypothetical protein